MNMYSSRDNELSAQSKLDILNNLLHAIEVSGICNFIPLHHHIHDQSFPVAILEPNDPDDLQQLLLAVCVLGAHDAKIEENRIIINSNGAFDPQLLTPPMNIIVTTRSRSAGRPVPPSAAPFSPPAPA